MTRLRRLLVILSLLLLGTSWESVNAFTITTKIFLNTRFQSPSRLYVERDSDGNIRKGPLEFLLDPKPTKIPPDLKDEIYRAEANTPAAKERQGRVIAYTIVAMILVGCAFFNVFLTELRSTVTEASGDSDGTLASLSDIGWGWVQENGILQFILATKVGGAFAIVGGAGSAMMMEAEIDSQRANAEKIWEELEKRRRQGPSESQKGSFKKKASSPAVSSGGTKNKVSGARTKRLAALAEVIRENTKVSASNLSEDKVMETKNDETDMEPMSSKDNGLLGTIKGWYEQADNMAAAQALLLNKELEDRGVLDKITDETGLRVIGKEAAAKLQQDNGDSSKNEKL
jgi:hypothetical protein